MVKSLKSDENEKINIDNPKPLQKVEINFAVTGWVPKLWFCESELGINNTLLIDFIDIKGQTFIGSSTKVDLNKTSESKDKFRLLMSVEFNHSNCLIIAESQGRINIKFSGYKANQYYFLPLIVKKYAATSSEDAETIKRHENIEDFIERNKKDYEDYLDECEKIRSGSHYVFNVSQNDKVKISLDIYDESLSKEAMLIYQQSEQLNIEITDYAKIDRLQKELDEKYKEAIEWRGACGGGIDFLPYISYCAITVTCWFLGHVFSDLDDAIWSKLKESIKKTFTLVKKKLPNKEILFVINRGCDMEAIVFILSKSLSPDEAEGALLKIKLTLESVDFESSRKDSFVPLVFQFDKLDKKWKKSPNFWNDQNR
jgi:hypothetical protein